MNDDRDLRRVAALLPLLAKSFSAEPRGGAGSAGRTSLQADRFTAAKAQTQFHLTKTPSDPQQVTFIVGGVIQELGVDYTVSGSTVTWLGASFVIEAGDKVRVDYFV
jgi:hypothetical protein